uniref:Uncharacterized protein n=1 Tax=Pararge aegeria TaxID=116150 RepID=S4P597_9NEOP
MFSMYPLYACSYVCFYACVVLNIQYFKALRDFSITRYSFFKCLFKMQFKSIRLLRLQTFYRYIFFVELDESTNRVELKLMYISF